MNHFIPSCLLQSRAIKRGFLAWMLLTAYMSAAGQEVAPKDDLDVTMQIIADPNAKLPDEIVRHIPIPTRKADRAASTAAASSDASKADQRSQKAQELADEMSKRSNEQAKEATDQREQSRRSAADEHRQNPPKNTPPGRPPR